MITPWVGWPELPDFLNRKKQMEQEKPTNPLSNFSDDQLIAAFRHTRDVVVTELTEAFKRDVAKPTAKMKLLQGELQRRLLERGAKHTSTESGTAMLVDTTGVECTDKDAYLKFCVENFDTWGKQLLTAAASKEAVELYIEKSKSEEYPNGFSPPGLTVTYATKCNIRK